MSFLSHLGAIAGGGLGVLGGPQMCAIGGALGFQSQLSQQAMTMKQINELFGAGLQNMYRPQPVPTDPFEQEYLWIVDGTGRTWGEFVDAGYR